jgi:hypothetical protein
MSQIEFGGYQDPIPSEAIPNTFLYDAASPLINLADGLDFQLADYDTLDYTHYEVICIGGAGGRGGNFPHSAFYSYGGAGGGGGLNRINGKLVDLPSSIPVVVGQPGANGIDGNGEDLYIMAQSYGLPEESFPLENMTIVDTGARPLQRGGHTYINAGGNMVPPYFMSDQLGNVVPPSDPDAIDYVMASVNSTRIAPEDGQDGESSSFGSICKASGGTGGKKSPLYVVYNGIYGGLTQQPGGDGGDGGTGGQILSGGGGTGGASIYNYWPEGTPGGFSGKYKDSTLVAAQNGTWDGKIGQGGGGGRGGTTFFFFDSTTGIDFISSDVSGNGGHGSYYAGDTSKSGAGGNAAKGYRDELVIPGAGGGETADKIVSYGSRNPASNPNGIVVIRFYKLLA